VDDRRNSACSLAEETFTVAVNKQPVAVAGENKVSCPGVPIDFDGSKSRDPDNDRLEFQWDFGDGSTAQGVQAAHGYEKAGTYKAMLTVSDAFGPTACSASSAGVNVFINAGPKAALAKNPPVCAGNKVVFDASGTSGKDSGDYAYSWDFGDGTTAAGGKKIAHEYKKGGRFTVKVTADDKRKTACSVDSAVGEIVVNTPPVAQGRADFACCIDTDSVFDAAESRDADADRLSYWWDFGDGAAAQGEKVTHRYTKGGTYAVTLKVDDNSGTACSGSQMSFKVVINESPVAVIKVK
jgi:chitodextrinase